MNNKRVLIVDDEPDICSLVELTLKRMGINSNSSPSLTDAITLLKNNRYDFCLTDMRLPDGDGLDLISHIVKYYPNTPVAMISAHGNMDTAIEALKRGAFDFLSKPIEINELKALILSGIELNKTEFSPSTSVAENEFIGSSDSAKKLHETILQVSRSQAPVYIFGESGSGKELCARIIHQKSSRSSGPFITVNCGAIPSELVESEFFGHKKGSFTGAHADKDGLFISAHKGTLFLDEIADLPLSMQVKLLRAIQEKSVRPVGGNEEIKFDVRILSASHKNLAKLVEQGVFRNDLYYRINVIEIVVPSLRERIDDIEHIANRILDKIAEEQQRPKLSISEAAIEKLKTHHFPGNIRELENSLQRASTFCSNSTITENELEFQVIDTPPPFNALTESNLKNNEPEHPTFSQRQPDQSLDDYLQAIEKSEIINALEKCRWNKTEAAKYLGMSFRSFRYRLSKLDLDE